MTSEDILNHIKQHLPEGCEVVSQSYVSGLEEDALVIKVTGDGNYAGYSITVAGVDDEYFEEE